MKALLQFIIMTSVVTLGSVVWGNGSRTGTTPNTQVATTSAAGQNTTAASAPQQQPTYQPVLPYEDQKKLLVTNTCIAQRTAIQTAYAKAVRDCKKSAGSISKCIDSANECSASNSTEQSGEDVLAGMFNNAFATQGMPGLNMTAGEYKGRCLSRSDFKDEKSSLNSNLDKAEDSVSRLQEKITKTKEDAEKQKRRANEALQDLMKDAREKDLKDKQDSRENSERSQADSLKMQTEIRQLRIEILRDQGNLAKLIGERTRTLAKLSNALIQKNCMEAIEKVRASIKNLSMGSANAVFNQNRTQRNRLKQDYDSTLR